MAAEEKPGISRMIREIWRPQVESQFPDLVEQYGFDAVWEAMGKVGQEQMRRETGLPL